MTKILRRLLITSAFLWISMTSANPAGDPVQDNILTFEAHGFFGIQDELLDLPDEMELRAKGYGSQTVVIGLNPKNSGQKKFYASVKLPIAYQYEGTPLNIGHYSGTLDSDLRFLTLNRGQQISVPYAQKKTIHFNTTSSLTENYRTSNRELHELVKSIKTEGYVTPDNVLVVEYTLSQVELENLPKVVHFKLGQAAFVHLLQSRIRVGGDKDLEPFKSILFELNSVAQ